MNFNSESLDLFDSEGEPNSSPELEAAKQGAELTKLLLRLKTPNAATIEALLGLTEEIYASAPESLESSLASLGRDLPAFPWLQSFMLEKAGNISGALAALDSFTAPSIGLDNELESFRLYSLARLSAALERWNKAISSLASSIRLTERFRALTRSFALLRSIEQSTEISYKRKYRVALVGNSTLDFILPAIKSYAFAAGIEVALYAGRYDQHCQELLDRSSALSAFEPDIIIIATNWRSLCLTEEHNDHGSIARDKTSEVTGLWDVCRDRWGAFVIQHNFEIPMISAYGRLSAAISGGRADIIRRINLRLTEAAELRPDVAVLDIEQIAARAGKHLWNDERLWIAARQYPAGNCIPLLARNQVALIRAFGGLMSKCIVLDLDGTLWGGAMGEDGLTGIALGVSSGGEAFSEFQKYLKGLRERGIMLAVCSRNNEGDAKAPFTDHSETVLKLNDFAVFVANWRPKCENIIQIARALDIGTDSIVFIDDNAVERAVVRRELPEVEVPELPEEAALFPVAIDRTLAFEAISITTEDRLRSTHNVQRLRKVECQDPLIGLEEFLAELRLELVMQPIDRSSISRVVQLLGKTNQFNLTSKRLTAKQVEEYLWDRSGYTQTVRLRDRYGDYGLTGVLLGTTSGADFSIDIWLMSCRILGRRIEDAMLVEAWNWAYSQGLERINGVFLPTAKNHPVSRLYDRLGFTLLAEDKNGVRKYRAELDSPKTFPRWISVKEA